jgi:hypothetical protein
MFGMLIEVVALAAGAIAVGALVTDDARLRELGWRFELGLRDSGGATVLIAVVLVGLGTVMRILLAKWIGNIDDSRPDMIPLLCVFVASYTSAGGLLFAGASAIVHVSLLQDDR